MTLLSSETLHATCVAVRGRAVLLTGRSGSGKSDLALRLLDRGAALVSDDYTLCKRVGERLVAEAPARIAGLLEVRGLGIVTADAIPSAPVALIVVLDREPDRLPLPVERSIAGIAVPEIALDAFQVSAAIKVEWALDRRTEPDT